MGHSRQDSLDGLRAIAVLFVMGFHFVPNVFPGGFVGVTVFFVLSDYFMSRILASPTLSLVDFYRARLLRIFPGMGVFLVVVCAVCGGRAFVLGQ